MDSPRHEYVVVARRYRPQTFDDLIGQSHVANSLKNAIQQGRVGHAYLFTGARGVGKTSAARILAKALNCRQGPTATPCNECEVCVSVTSGEDVDVLEIDGASNRGIDEIRQLRQNVGIRPSRVRFKVYIIDEVHMLTKEAFNALLKTLEEPPEHVKFIFATTEPHKVPITILSRCQRFDFAGIDATLVEHRLAEIAASEGVEADTEALQILARRAAGSMRDGQSLLEQLLAGSGGRIDAADVTRLLGIAPAVRLAELARSLVQQDAAAALEELDAAIAEGSDVGQLVEQLLGFFRDVLVRGVGCEPDQMLYALPAQDHTVAELARQLGVQKLLAILQVLEEALARMRNSVHVRTITEMALVRIASLDDLDAISALIAELRGTQSPAAGTASPPRRTAPPDRPPDRVSDEQVKKNAAPLGSLPPLPSRAASTGDPPSDARANDPIAVSPAAASSADASSTAPPANSSSSVGMGAGSAERPTTSVPFDSEQIPQLWSDAIRSIEGFLSGQAAKVSRVLLGPRGNLIAWFAPRYVSCKEFCEQSSHRVRLEEAFAEVAGHRLAIEFAIDARLANGEAAGPTYRSNREIKQEIGQRPFVRCALELFGDESSEFQYTPPE